MKVNYTGWLTNGKKFDSSIGRGPFTVQPLGNAPVIKGWNEGIVGMKVGGKRQLRIPADLAYGDEGYGEDIAPGSTLVFDVELLSIKKNAGNTPPAPGQQPENDTEKKPSGS